jgi:hypothetical protein
MRAIVQDEVDVLSCATHPPAQQGRLGAKLRPRISIRIRRRRQDDISPGPPQLSFFRARRPNVADNTMPRPLRNSNVS